MHNFQYHFFIFSKFIQYLLFCTWRELIVQPNWMVFKHAKPVAVYMRKP